MFDAIPPHQRPPLMKELSDGTAHVGVKILLTVTLAAIGVAAALFGAYACAALNPAWDRYRSSRSVPGAHPTDELMLAMSVLAGVGFLAAVAWLWSRGRANRVMIHAGVLSIAIIGATIALCALAESALRGDNELVIAGIAFLGFAGLLLMWLAAVRRRGPRGRTPVDPRDGKLDVRCPGCGYRMVGLRESRCPECGAEYTLDELLALQRFAAAAAAPAGAQLSIQPAPPPPLPPPVPHTRAG